MKVAHSDKNKPFWMLYPYASMYFLKLHIIKLRPFAKCLYTFVPQ